MALSHAVVWLDHHKAHISQFNATEEQSHHIEERSHQTRQQRSGVRTEHEFFGEVCDGLAGITKVLITGGHTTQADFRHYVEKHAPGLQAQIIGWETVDHPSPAQLLAFGRTYFAKHDRMDKVPAPN